MTIETKQDIETEQNNINVIADLIYADTVMRCERISDLGDFISVSAIENILRLMAVNPAHNGLDLHPGRQKYLALSAADHFDQNFVYQMHEGRLKITLK